MKASFELIKTAEEELVSVIKLNNMADLSVASCLMELACLCVIAAVEELKKISVRKNEFAQKCKRCTDAVDRRS